jgi:hypothetical protein
VPPLLPYTDWTVRTQPHQRRDQSVPTRSGLAWKRAKPCFVLQAGIVQMQIKAFVRLKIPHNSLSAMWTGGSGPGFREPLRRRLI